MRKREAVLIDPDLHRKLKQFAAEREGATIGAIADEYIRAGVAKDEQRKARVA